MVGRRHPDDLVLANGVRIKGSLRRGVISLYGKQNLPDFKPLTEDEAGHAGFPEEEIKSFFPPRAPARKASTPTEADVIEKSIHGAAITALRTRAVALRAKAAQAIVVNEKGATVVLAEAHLAISLAETFERCANDLTATFGKVIGP